MADKWPAANGNWSTAANWNGGTLPQPGDDVYADGKTVTIDQDINVVSIQTTQRSGGTAGGGFTIPAATGTRNITANIIAGTTGCLANIGAGTTGPVTVTGNIIAGSGASAAGMSATVGTVIVNGNITGGPGGTSAIGLITGTGLVALTINGNITGATGGTGVGVRLNTISGTTLVTITGTLQNTATAGALTSIAAGNILTLNGTITSTSSSTPVILLNAGAATITLINTLTKRNSINIGNATVKIVGSIDAATEDSGVVSVDNDGTLTVVGNVLGSTTNTAGVGVLILLADVFIVGNLTGRLAPAVSTGSNLLNTNKLMIVDGTVTGSSTASTGYGILNQGVNNVYVYGSVVDGSSAVGISNTSTGTSLVTETVQESEPMEETLTETPIDISGNFGLSVFGIEGAPVYLMKSMGSGTTDFHLYKTYIDKDNGFHDIPNLGTNSWKVETDSPTAVVKVSN